MAPAYGYPTSDRPGGNQQYASFWARLGARLIDSLVVLLIMLPFLIVAWIFLRQALDDCFSYTNDAGNRSIECPDGALKGGPLAISIILVVVGSIVGLIVYCRWLGRGQTPGMKATNIRVVDANTSAPIGTGRAVGRYFASILSGIPCYLGYLWMLWDGRKQTWHDKIVHSVVLKA